MEEKYINNNWLFRFGENVGDEFANDLQDYSAIGLPHSFGIPYYGEKDFFVGYGCYSHQLILEAKDTEQAICIEFGGVFQVAEVFLNGKFVAKHEGGYNAFVCDISSCAQVGANTLFVRVNNLWQATLAPRAGEHTFNGGIYRDVKLLTFPTKHIDWKGVFVSTRRVAHSQAEICISTETTNCIGQTLLSTILDKDGNAVAKASCVVAKQVSSQVLTITAPQLWSPDKPYLYTLQSEICDDKLQTTFGVRTILWDKDTGFFLNGKRLLLNGANVHQDHGGWGDAVTHTAIARDVAMMKECGFNFIRGSHYPHHEQFARECDKQGMLFWSENVFWGIGGFKADGDWESSAMPLLKEQVAPFEQSLRASLAEMVRINRNSPSVVCWSMGNEMFFSDKKVLSAARKLVSRLVEYSHEIDPTRPAAVGGVQRGGFDTLGDIAGYNGDGATLFKHPSKPNVVAEYGSIPAYRPGKYDLYETAGSDEYYPWRAGRAIWCGFHHGSIADIGNLGIVDLYRLPLRAWYAYREKLRGIAPPTFSSKGAPDHMTLFADTTTITANGTQGAFLVAQVCDKDGRRVRGNFDITMRVLSGGGLLPTGKEMLFSEALKSSFDGACAIELRGYFGGESVIECSCKGLTSATVAINIVGDENYCGQEIIYPLAPQEKIDDISTATKAEKYKFDKSKTEKSKFDKRKSDKADLSESEKTRFGKTKTDFVENEKTRFGKSKSEKVKDEKLKFDKPKQKYIDILNDRPVTTSSEFQLGSSLCLTSASDCKMWRPATNDTSPYIILDLEHCYDSCDMTIRRPFFAEFECAISLSLDKENWTVTAQKNTKMLSKNIEIEITSPARYVRIDLSGKKICLQHINCRK